MTLSACKYMLVLAMLADVSNSRDAKNSRVASNFASQEASNIIFVHKLKGQSHKMFCFRFFSWIIFTPTPENSTRVISNIFENPRWYSQVKMHHRSQQTGGKFVTVINDTGGKFCHRYCWCRWYWQIGVNNTGGKLAASVNDNGRKSPLASTIPAVNLPPLSLTPVAFLPLVSTTPAVPVAKFSASVIDTGGKFTIGANNTGVASWAANISVNFRKNSKRL